MFNYSYLLNQRSVAYNVLHIEKGYAQDKNETQFANKLQH